MSKGTNKMNTIAEKHDCSKHDGMTCEEYDKSKDMKEDVASEQPLNSWLNDERYNLLMKRFGISEKKTVKNAGPYKIGMKKGYDTDGDGVPDGADKDPYDGSIKEVSKKTIKKGHEIAKAIEKEGGDVENPYAVGMAQAMGTAKHKKGKK